MLLFKSKILLVFTKVIIAFSCVLRKLMNIIEKSKKGFPNFNFSNLLVLVFITYVIRVYYNVISLV